MLAANQWGDRTLTKPMPFAATAAALLCLGFAGAASAASNCPPGLPPGIVCGAPDYHLAPAGHYTADPQHAGIVARVSHIGYSYSVFRFGDVKADLAWDPAHPDASGLSATVKTASIATPVPNFATELAGPNFLSSTAFPDATFTSTAFHQSGPTKGRVDGVFTLRGKSAPLSLDVELVGAGPGFGSPRMGVHAEGWVKPGDYGMPGMFAAPIELLLDVEFVKAAG
jgi:polyisoprenoid-binding protein YceI